MIITDQGVLIRLPVSQIRSIGRATQGVRLIKLGAGTKVSSITRIISEEEKTKDEPKNEPTDNPEPENG
jgi:DNA gyrase subunit A